MRFAKQRSNHKSRASEWWFGPLRWGKFLRFGLRHLRHLELCDLEHWGCCSSSSSCSSSGCALDQSFEVKDESLHLLQRKAKSIEETQDDMENLSAGRWYSFSTCWHSIDYYLFSTPWTSSNTFEQNWSSQWQTLRLTDKDQETKNKSSNQSVIWEMGRLLVNSKGCICIETFLCHDGALYSYAISAWQNLQELKSTLSLSHKVHHSSKRSQTLEWSY